jgi:glycosyltransferase involved in cell wall biosynthesis
LITERAAVPLGHAPSREVSGGSRSGERIRVLWLIKGLGAGGAERLLCLAAEARDRRIFDCEAAYLLPWKDALVGGLEAAGVPVTCLRGGREWDLRWAIRLRRLLRKRKVEILHVHSPYVAGIARLTVRSLPTRLRPKIVYTEHLPWPGYVLPTRWLNALTFPLDDAHIAVSEAVRASVPRPLRKRLSVVIHGIATERVRAARASRNRMRRELGTRRDEILVGTLANFRPQKRYPDLLRAARLAIDTGAPVRFAAAGGGTDSTELRQLHRDLQLGDRFQLLGQVDDPARFLSACDLFVLASEFEGLPLAMMEALTLGLPVVATDVAGIRGEVRHGEEALLIPVGRPDLIAKAVVSLALDPPRRARMAHAARARSGRFDMATAVRRLEMIYRDLLPRA